MPVAPACSTGRPCYDIFGAADFFSSFRFLKNPRRTKTACCISSTKLSIVVRNSSRSSSGVRKRFVRTSRSNSTRKGAPPKVGTWRSEIRWIQQVGVAYSFHRPSHQLHSSTSTSWGHQRILAALLGYGGGRRARHRVEFSATCSPKWRYTSCFQWPSRALPTATTVKWAQLLPVGCSLAFSARTRTKARAPSRPRHSLTTKK